MHNSNLYILMVLGGLAVVAVWAFFIKNPQRVSLLRLAALTFVSMIAGMFLTRQELIGYGLMVVGLALGIIDIVIKWQQKHNEHAHH